MRKRVAIDLPRVVCKEKGMKPIPLLTDDELRDITNHYTEEFYLMAAFAAINVFSPQRDILELKERLAEFVNEAVKRGLM